jgi:hypothetical protein
MTRNTTAIFANYRDNITRLRAMQIMDNLAFVMAEYYDRPYGTMSPTSIFNDVNSTMAHQAIRRLHRIGVARGAGGANQGSFLPNAPSTRQEFAVAFARLIGYFRYGDAGYIDDNTPVPHDILLDLFGNDHCHCRHHSDTRVQTWARGSVSYLAYHDYVRGVGNRHFEAQRNMTVQEMMTMAVRAYVWVAFAHL